MSGPCRYRVEASFGAVAAAWGSDAPNGRAVMLAMARAIGGMPLGRLDCESFVNVALIEGASAVSGVEPQSADLAGSAGELQQRCCIAFEVMSPLTERAEEIVGEVVDALHEAANSPDSTCDLRVRIESLAGSERRPEPVRRLAGAGAVTA